MVNKFVEYNFHFNIKLIIIFETNVYSLFDILIDKKASVNFMLYLDVIHYIFIVKTKIFFSKMFEKFLL